jgi:hypothetical protein
VGTIFTYNGKILAVDKKLAANEECCCGCECPVLCFPEPNCFGLNFLCIRWSGCVCCDRYNAPDGALVGEFIALPFNGVAGNRWTFSTSTESAELYCIDGQWKFEYVNTSGPGIWSMFGVLGCNKADPCNVVGLSTVADAEWNLLIPDLPLGPGGEIPPEERCVGQGKVNISVVGDECLEC